jgi:hypothetical protein
MDDDKTVPAPAATAKGDGNANGVIIYIVALACLCAGFAFAFHSNGFSDSDYGYLVSSGMSLDSVSQAGLALFIIMPFIAFAILHFLLKFDATDSFLAGAALASAGAWQNLSAISPYISPVLGKQFPLTDALIMAIPLLPLAAAALLHGATGNKFRILCAVGAILLPFAPGPALFLLALCVPSGLEAMRSEKGIQAEVALAVFGACVGYSSGIEKALAIAAVCFACAYAARVIRGFGREVTASAMAFMVFASLLIGAQGALSAHAGALTQGEAALFSSLKGAQGAYGVLDYPNAFRYYSGITPQNVTAKQLLSERPQGMPDTIVYSYRSFSQALSARPIMFAYAGMADSQNRTYAYFSAQKYGLYMRYSGNEPLPEDGIIQGADGSTARVLFTKMKPLYSAPLNSTLLINTDGIEKYALYRLFFQSGADFSNGSVAVRLVQ